jgi:type IV pilus assembly protein PilC
MMKAGVPLVQGFEIVAEGLENPAMREVVLGIKGEVEGGNTFAGALRSIHNILTIFLLIS